MLYLRGLFLNKKLAKLHPFFGELQNGSRTPFLAFNECEQSMKAYQSSFHSVWKSPIKVSFYKIASEASNVILTPFHLVQIHFKLLVIGPKLIFYPSLLGRKLIFTPLISGQKSNFTLFIGPFSKIFKLTSVANWRKNSWDIYAWFQALFQA